VGVVWGCGGRGPRGGVLLGVGGSNSGKDGGGQGSFGGRTGLRKKGKSKN